MWAMIEKFLIRDVGVGMARESVSAHRPVAGRGWRSEAPLVTSPPAAANALPPPPHEGFPMANIKSQVKRNRQNVVRNDRNKAVRSEVKTRMKNALAAAESGDAAAATEATQEAQKKIDMAVSKGVMKKNTAARRKSRLQREVNRLLES